MVAETKCWCYTAYSCIDSCHLSLLYFRPIVWELRAGKAKSEPAKVDVSVSAGAKEQSAESAARKPRALAPGSFLRHMLSSKHTASQQPFSDLEITAQAFIFLLAGEPSLSKPFVPAIA